MATWDDVEKLTWDQMEHFTWDEVERLTKDQVDRFINEIWPVIASLSPADRAAFQSGLLDGSLPPALLADGVTDYSPAQGAALKLWPKQEPLTRDQLLGWIAILLSIVQILQTEFKDEPAPVQAPPSIVQEVHIHMPEYTEIPPHLRPLIPRQDVPEAPVTPVEKAPQKPTG